jgi:hypothetical protein
MQFNLDRLKEIVYDLKARLDLQPTFGWAVVTSVTPLLIRYDGQTEAIAGTPDRIVTDLAIGDRVWCQRIHRRDIILGRAGGTPRHRTGVVSKGTGPLTVIGTTNIWGAAMEIPVPVVLRPGEYLRLTVVNIGTGWGAFEQVGLSAGIGSTTVFGRFTQINNSGAQTLTFFWEVVSPTE